MVFVKKSQSNTYRVWRFLTDFVTMQAETEDHNNCIKMST